MNDVKGVEWKDVAFAEKAGRFVEKVVNDEILIVTGINDTCKGCYVEFAVKDGTESKLSEIIDAYYEKKYGVDYKIICEFFEHYAIYNGGLNTMYGMPEYILTEYAEFDPHEFHWSEDRLEVLFKELDGNALGVFIK